MDDEGDQKDANRNLNLKHLDLTVFYRFKTGLTGLNSFEPLNSYFSGSEIVVLFLTCFTGLDSVFTGLEPVLLVWNMLYWLETSFTG